MRALVDLTDLVPGQMGGIEEYVSNLIKGLMSGEYSSHSFHFVVNNRDVGYFGHLPPNMRYIPWDKSGFTRLLAKKPRLLRLWREWNGINARNYDVLHFPFQSIRYTVRGVPTIVSIMDIQHEFLPEFFGKEELNARRLGYPATLSRADRVIAISEYTADTISEVYGFPRAKISVIYLAIKEPSRHKKSPLFRYLYYPAASWPHRNHIRLIKAFSKFKKRHPTYKLIFSGASKQENSRIENLVDSLALGDSVVHLGFVSEKKKVELYANARAVIFPSLFEGFGMPVLEALSYQVPVACSDIPVLREVCGDLALYFDPKSIKSIESAMEKVAQRRGESDKKKSAHLLAQYSIEKMTRDTMAVYGGASEC